MRGGSAMDEFSRRLDDTLLTAYRYTVKIENQFLQRIGELNVTGSEMHLLEVIGKSEGKCCTVKQDRAGAQHHPALGKRRGQPFGHQGMRRAAALGRGRQSRLHPYDPSGA